MGIKRGWSDAEQQAYDDEQRQKGQAGGVNQAPAPPGGFVHRVHNPAVYGGGEADVVVGKDGVWGNPAGPTSAEKELARYRSLGEAAANREAYKVDFSKSQGDRANSLDARSKQLEAAYLQSNAALGNAPSRAAIEGNQVAGQSLEATLAAGAGGRGLASSAMQAQAARGQGAMQLQGGARSVGMRAGEIGRAVNAFGGGMTSIRGGDYANMKLSAEQAEAQAQAEIAQRKLNQSGQMGYEQAGLNVEQAELDARMRGAVASNTENATAQAASDARGERAMKVYKAGVGTIGAIAGGTGSDARIKQNVTSFSDAQAKKEAYALGRAHQWEQGKTGKPVEWAHEMPKDIAERGEMSGDRGHAKPAGGRAAASPVGRVVPPRSDEERAQMAWRAGGKPEAAPEGPGMLARGADAVQGAFSSAAQSAPVTAAADFLAPREQPMGPQEAPAPGLASYAARARAMVSDGRTKKKVDPMTDALADGLAPHSWEYKDGFREAEGQRPGEKNVGIIAQNAEKNPITGVIVEQDDDGIRRINLKKSTSLALAAAGHNAQRNREMQAEIDQLKGGR